MVKRKNQSVIPSKMNAQSSSSSDSSEDEEEAKRIAAAVCDSSILHLFNNNKGSGGKSDTQGMTHLVDGLSSKGSDGSAVTRKSNRPVDVNDDDKNNLLQTTPEFRAHVSKQLSHMLENELCETVGDGVWNKTGPKACHDMGIRLFSDSKSLFKLETLNQVEKEGQSISENSQSDRKKRRKVRLSTSSSESDEDERIQACIQTAEEVQRQAELMTRVEAVTGTMQAGTGSPALRQSLKTASISGQTAAAGQSGAPCSTGQVSAKTKKKKKKKKKKMSEESEATPGCVSVL